MRKMLLLKESQLKKLAQELGKKYKGKNLTIGLTGSLGAGKTTFAKAFLQSLGIKRAKSPTFIIFNHYLYKLGECFHFDLYRINSYKELENLGWSEFKSNNRSLILVEWADKFPKILKQCNLVVNLKVRDKKTRYVTIGN